MSGGSDLVAGKGFNAISLDRNGGEEKKISSCGGAEVQTKVASRFGLISF